MLVVLVFASFVLLVLFLAWRTKDSPRAPKTCCSRSAWPPDDITARGER